MAEGRTAAPPALVRMDASAAPTSIVAALREHGAVILDGLSPASTIAQASEELEPLLQEATQDGFVTSLSGVLDRPTVGALACHPKVLAVCEEFLSPGCDSIQLNIAMARRVHPGAAAQALHQDRQTIPDLRPDAWQGLPLQWGIVCLWALDDFTSDNGTRIIPDSHLWRQVSFPRPTCKFNGFSRDEVARGRVPSDEEAVDVTMPRGSALLFSCGCVHGAKPNTSDTARTGLLIGYTLGWVRPVENTSLSTPPQVACHLPKRLKELLGYHLHNGLMGFPDLAQRDPDEWLERMRVGGKRGRE